MATTPHPPPTAPVSIPMPDEVYRPDIVQNLFNTPGSTPRSDGGFTCVPITADPVFSTDEYEVSDIAPRSSSTRRKGKEPAIEMSGGEKQKRPRSTYTEAESKFIAECWADISQDATIGTNHTELKFWARVHETYMENRRPGIKDHSPQQIRRHWERLMKECEQFNGIYTNLLNQASSGETEHSVRKEANSRYAALYNVTHGFMWCDIYDVFKDLPKYRRGMHQALQVAPVDRRKLQQLPEPIDLSKDRPP